ncbi:MAG TPA: hypothetical protein VNW92_03740, partial [Polyangiaceae bacterium]|nr:hypothetical protein [Polyangiaceae bacterium]
MAATRAWVSGGVLGLVAVIGASACGSSSQSSNPSGAGQAGASGTAATSGGSGGAAGGSAAGNGGTSGSPGSAGSSAGAGGSAGAGLVLGDSETEACIAYALAECMRQEACDGFTPSETDCLQATFGCPEILLSGGSTRTAAGLKACAPAFATLACTDFNAGKLPDCATPGTRPLGAPCDHSTECATLDCSYRAGGACGLCAKVGELGDDCSVAANTECREGLSCVADKCGPLAASNAIRAEGEDCSTPAVNCAPNLYCVTGTNVCAPSPMLGMSCATTHACQASYCAKATQMCT